MNKRIWIYSLVITVFVLIFINSCKKDENDSNDKTTTVPTLSTADVTDITGSTATCGGNDTSDGGSSVTAKGVCWGLNNNPSLSDSYSSDGSGTGTYASYITGLSPTTTYYARAYATNSSGTGYGSSVQFTTISAIIDGKYFLLRNGLKYYITISNVGSSLLFEQVADVLVCSVNYENRGKLTSNPSIGFIVEGEWYKFARTSGICSALYFVVQQKDNTTVIVRESNTDYETAYNLGTSYTYAKI